MLYKKRKSAHHMMTRALSFLVLQPIISLVTDLGEEQWFTVKMN